MNHLDSHQMDMLKRELIGLFEHIQGIRKEIAAIRRPGSDTEEDHFSQMGCELDAIAVATEGATNTIMEKAEQIEGVISTIRNQVGDSQISGLLDQIPDKTGTIFEACAFQDITGQRLTKVVRSLQFIETRVNVLIDMWGVAALTKVEGTKDEEKDDYQKYLNGPSLDGQGVSQADVDAIFGSTGFDDEGGGPSSQPAPAPLAKVSLPTPPSPPSPKMLAAKAVNDEETDPQMGQDDIDALFR